MSETQTATQPKVASVGAPKRAEFVLPNKDQANGQQGGQQNQNQNSGEGANAGAGGDAGGNNGGQQGGQNTGQQNKSTNTNTGGTDAGAGAGAGGSAPVVDITEDQLKAHFEKMGIEYTGIDNLKEKLKPKDEPATPEQKLQREKDFEKRMLDLFVQGKGTIEQFTQIKSLANADVNELSQSELRRELKEAKFTDEEINDMVGEYSQAADEELEKYEDETERAFIKRKKEYASKLMENRALSIKQAAEQVLNGLKSAIESEDLQRQDEEQLASKIDDHFNTVPRKLTFKLGSENNREIDPIEYEVAETDLAEIRDTLKDPAKRNQFLFNEEGKLNLDNLANVLLRNKILESALKRSYLIGETKNTEHFEGTFGARTAQGVGVGGVNTKAGEKGSVASIGKTTRVMPSAKKIT